MKDYGAIEREAAAERRIRSLQRKVNRSKAETDYLTRVAGTSTRFQGVNQRQRRKRERQVGR